MNKLNLRWNVYRYNINRTKIEIFNIFDHGGFEQDITKALAKFKSRKSFAEEVESSLLYYYWAKSEWEIIISPWVGNKDNSEIKVDVYQQIKNNWDIFIDYILDNTRHLHEICPEPEEI